MPGAINLVKNWESEKLQPQPIFPEGRLSQAQLDSTRDLFLSLPFYRGLLYNAETGAYLMGKQAQENGISLQQAEQGFLRALRPTTLIQRFSTTEEVANMIVYACSEQASATSGAALRVDGGIVRFVA